MPAQLHPDPTQKRLPIPVERSSTETASVSRFSMSFTTVNKLTRSFVPPLPLARKEDFNRSFIQAEQTLLDAFEQYGLEELKINWELIKMLNQSWFDIFRKYELTKVKATLVDGPALHYSFILQHKNYYIEHYLDQDNDDNRLDISMVATQKGAVVSSYNYEIYSVSEFKEIFCRLLEV